MTIDQAIKILIHYDTDLDAWNDEPNDEAVRLGIQALEWIRQNRYANYPHHIPLLAGESSTATGCNV